MIYLLLPLLSNYIVYAADQYNSGVSVSSTSNMSTSSIRPRIGGKHNTSNTTMTSLEKTSLPISDTDAFSTGRKRQLATRRNMDNSTVNNIPDKTQDALEVLLPPPQQIDYMGDASVLGSSTQTQPQSLFMMSHNNPQEDNSTIPHADTINTDSINTSKRAPIKSRLRTKATQEGGGDNYQYDSSAYQTSSVLPTQPAYPQNKNQTNDLIPIESQQNIQQAPAKKIDELTKNLPNISSNSEEVHKSNQQVIDVLSSTNNRDNDTDMMQILKSATQYLKHITAIKIQNEIQQHDQNIMEPGSRRHDSQVVAVA